VYGERLGMERGWRDGERWMVMEIGWIWRGGV